MSTAVSSWPIDALHYVPPKATRAVLLVLSLCAVVATSIYFNVPAVWNAPGARRADRLYNPQPPVAYRLVRGDGPLRRASAWCHALAALLCFAAVRARARRRGGLAQHRAGAWRDGRRHVPALAVFHAVACISLTTGHGALGAALLVLTALLAWSAHLGSERPGPPDLTQRPRMAHVPPLLMLGLALTIGAVLMPCVSASPALRGRVAQAPALAELYAAEWAALLGAIALLAGLVLRSRPVKAGKRDGFSVVTVLVCVVAATVVVASADWYRRPLPNFGEAVPGVLYYSGQPEARSLARAHGRYGFRTIVYVHPNTGTAAHAEEVHVARQRGIRLIAAQDEEFRPEDLLRIARDPSARPVLLHCIEGRNRTPAWLAVYRIVEQRWSTREAFAEMERISGRRLKSYTIDWVERTAARLMGPARVAGANAQQNDTARR